VVAAVMCGGEGGGGGGRGESGGGDSGGGGGGGSGSGGQRLQRCNSAPLTLLEAGPCTGSFST